MFVHLAPEKASKAIRRTGIKPSEKRTLPDGSRLPSGVFAMPVVPNFYISHQWLRELKASGSRTIIGVYFRIPDDEVVLIGHYNLNHREVTAAEAIRIIMHTEQAEGYEVIILRKIQPSEVHKIRHLPQVIGWRYYPGAHGNPPCGCQVCQPEDRSGSRRIGDIE